MADSSSSLPDYYDVMNSHKPACLFLPFFSFFPPQYIDQQTFLHCSSFADLNALNPGAADSLFINLENTNKT